MFQGKVNAVLCFVSDQSHGSFLPISASVRDSTILNKLVKKYFSPMPATPASLIITDAMTYRSCHSVIFEQLDEHVICQTALHLGSAARPFGVNTFGWHCLCISFHAASTDLCSLALVARRISTSFVDPMVPQPLL